MSLLSSSLLLLLLLLLLQDVENVDNGYAPDSAAAETKALEAWLPVTGNRKAKWWYAAFHNVTAMVGAGVLGLPTAMQWLTW
jgi:hypothetical protein